jgi:hypothetical protein
VSLQWFAQPQPGNRDAKWLALSLKRDKGVLTRMVDWGDRLVLSRESGKDGQEDLCDT